MLRSACPTGLLVRTLPLAVFAAAAACGAKISSPKLVPDVDVVTYAEFADADQDYGRTLERTDSDGDGADELVVGGPSNDPNWDGIVLFVELGTFHVVNAVFPWRDSGETSDHHDEYGSSQLLADLDGDGRLDLAVGDPGADGPTTERAGEVWVYFAPIEASTPVRLRSATPSPGARFGQSLASGDFDGDGYGDLAVGAPHPTDLTTATDDPSVDVYFGPDLTRREHWAALGGGGRFGSTLVVLPQDAGAATLVAGAPEAAVGATGQGDAFAFARGAGAATTRRLNATAAVTGFGLAAETGDFDGDGARELAFVAPQGDAGIWFFDPVSLAARGGRALPAALGQRGEAPVRRLADRSRDGADELVLLSATRADPAAVVFSPGRGSAFLRLDFAAASVVVGNFDFDPDQELLFATPTTFKPSGGFALLRLVDLSWKENQKAGVLAARTAPATIPGARELRAAGVIR